MRKFTLLAAILMVLLCGSGPAAGADDSVSAQISGKTDAPPSDEKYIQQRLSWPAQPAPKPEKPAADTPPPATKPEPAPKAKSKESQPAPAPKAKSKASQPAPAPKAKPKASQPAPAPKAKPKESQPAPAPKAKPEAGTEAPPPASGPAPPNSAKIEYYIRLRDLMMANWKSPGREAWPGISPKAMLCVIIEPDGRVERHQLREPSGYDDFDRLVLDTLEKSRPFPPLPPVFGGQPDRPCFIFDLDEIERLKKSQGR